MRIITRLAVQWFQLKGSIEAAVSRGASLDCLFELSAYRKGPVKGPFELVLYLWRELHESRAA